MSVLLKCAAGLHPIDQGRIDALDQTDIDDWSDLRPRIGILFQRNALFDTHEGLGERRLPPPPSWHG